MVTTFEYLERYTAIYNARDTRRRFIPLEKISASPEKYGYADLRSKLPKDYKSNAKQGAFINSKYKITAAICANRSGKSEALATKAIKTLESIKVDKGGSYWILTESFDLQKSGIQTKINIYIKPERIAPDSISYVKKGVYHSFDYINKWNVRIPVEFKTYEQGSSKLQAAKLYGATFDEEPPEDVFDEVRMRTTDLAGKVDMGFTPLKGFTWSYARILNSTSSLVKCFNWGMKDNPFIPREEIEHMRNDLSPKRAKMRLEGIYQGSDGMVFDSFERDSNIKKDLYNPNLPVSVSIDWGVVCVSVGFFQEKTIIKELKDPKEKSFKEYYLFDAFEMTGAGYGDVMNRIRLKNYYIPSNEWFCDPAGSARSQATRTGVSLLQKIKNDYGVSFNYIKRLGVEESIDLTNSLFKNSNKEVRFYIQDGVKLNEKGHTPSMRIEGYIRDEKTGQPIKDGINDHFCDMLRYYVANKLRSEMREGFKQH